MCKAKYCGKYCKKACLFFFVVDEMKSLQYVGLLLSILTTVLIAPAGTKHITVTLDAKWKSTPLLLEAW